MVGNSTLCGFLCSNIMLHMQVHNCCLYKRGSFAALEYAAHTNVIVHNGKRTKIHELISTESIMQCFPLYFCMAEIALHPPSPELRARCVCGGGGGTLTQNTYCGDYPPQRFALQYQPFRQHQRSPSLGVGGRRHCVYLSHPKGVLKTNSKTKTLDSCPPVAAAATLSVSCNVISKRPSIDKGVATNVARKLGASHCMSNHVTFEVTASGKSGRAHSTFVAASTHA